MVGPGHHGSHKSACRDSRIAGGKLSDGIATGLVLPLGRGIPVGAGQCLFTVVEVPGKNCCGKIAAQQPDCPDVDMARAGKPALEPRACPVHRLTTGALILRAAKRVRLTVPR